MNWFDKFTREIRRFCVEDNEGAIIIFFAVYIPVAIAFAALVGELGYAYGRQGGMQAAVDAAAMAGAVQTMASPPPYGAATGSSSEINQITNEVYASLSYSGYSNGKTSQFGTVSVAPPSFTSSGSDYVITVTLTDTWYLPFLAAANSFRNTQYSSTPIRATASALAQWRGDICMLALAPSGTGFRVAGAGTIGSSTTPPCGIAVDSSDSCAFDSRGTSASINVPLYTVGGVCTTGNPTIPPISHGYPVNDPYNPDVRNALINAYNAAAPNVVNPPTVCSNNVCTVDLGANQMLSSDFFKNNLCSTCQVIINSATGLIPVQNLDSKKTNQTISYAHPSTMIVGSGSMTIGGGVSTRFDAPESGTFAGISIACILACAGVTVGGSAIMNGSIYAPSAAVAWAGNPTSPCVQIIANTITSAGTVSLTDGCITPALRMRVYNARLIR